MTALACPDVELEHTLRYKQNLAREVVMTLQQCSDDVVIQALATRIEACNADSNLYVASDFHTGDGELFNAKGSLWHCNSRFCPNCVSHLAKQNRKKIKYLLENEKLLVGEFWFMPTFTMPDAALKELPLHKISEVMKVAWEKFTHCEPNPSKSKTWFQKHIRGGNKNCEFTYTNQDLYHFHIHALVIGKASLQRDKCYEIRFRWTKALQFAFKKMGVEWHCPTGNKHFLPALYMFLMSKASFILLSNVVNELKFFGLANVNLQKIKPGDFGDVIRELCKYVTKSDSWSKIPPEQLEEVALIGNFGRMFETFGVCRETVRQMKKKPVSGDADNSSRPEDFYSNVINGAYIYTNNLIPSKILLKLMNAQGKAKKRRKSWRIRCRDLPFPEFKQELYQEIAECQDFRNDRLRYKYDSATFWALNGEDFSV